MSRQKDRVADLVFAVIVIQRLWKRYVRRFPDSAAKMLKSRFLKAARAAGHVGSVKAWRRPSLKNAIAFGAQLSAAAALGRQWRMALAKKELSRRLLQRDTDAAARS